jgi:hypothetical protein
MVTASCFPELAVFLEGFREKVLKRKVRGGFAKGAKKSGGEDQTAH